MAAPPHPRFQFNGSAFRNSPPEIQQRTLQAYRCMNADPSSALALVDELIADPRNPMVYEALMIRGRIALEQNRIAEACVDFDRAAHPSMLLHPSRGSSAENMPVYESNRAISQYLQAKLRRPRMLNRPPRRFEIEASLETCHVDTLRGWALGQNLPMPALTDSLALAALRKELHNRFQSPLGEYLVIPPSGEPYRIWPSQCRNVLYMSIGLRSVNIYNDDMLERFMGNSRGFPEGYFFRIFEAIMHVQPSVNVPTMLARNDLATTLLHTKDVIYGPVLVHMCYLLKHTTAPNSLVVMRKPPTVAFLRSPEWKQMRMEFRALLHIGDEGFEVTSSEIALENAQTSRYHVHAQ